MRGKSARENELVTRDREESETTPIAKRVAFRRHVSSLGKLPPSGSRYLATGENRASVHLGDDLDVVVSLPRRSKSEARAGRGDLKSFHPCGMRRRRQREGKKNDGERDAGLDGRVRRCR